MRERERERKNVRGNQTRSASYSPSYQYMCFSHMFNLTSCPNNGGILRTKMMAIGIAHPPFNALIFLTKGDNQLMI